MPILFHFYFSIPLIFFIFDSSRLLGIDLTRKIFCVRGIGLFFISQKKEVREKKG